ncbi:DUF1772 domain-containing protein [Streptomyces sp. NPDC001941]|uniref:anthrone oxygenase family protein n=1 Tax=Streptomyces sp. NPDC001941 TaxID=3154659 RepID=UPI00331932A4
MPSLLLGLAVVSTGLYAGFMLIFMSGIMPALRKLTDQQFVAAMCRINEEVPRGVFGLCFLALVVFPAVALAVPVDGRSDTQFWLIVAALVCGVLNHLVTIAGNIPLNTALARAEGGDPKAARAAFEDRWNRIHAVRTLFIVASFGLITAATLN